MMCIPFPFDLIILYFPFLPRQSPFCAPHFFIFSSSYYFPRPFFVYMAFNILLFLREWPAQAREFGVDTFSFLTWAILELCFGYGKWVQMAFPLIDQL